MGFAFQKRTCTVARAKTEDGGPEMSDTRKKDEFVWSIIKLLGAPAGRQGQAYGALYEMGEEQLRELEARVVEATEELKAVHKKLLSPAVYRALHGD